MARMRKEVEAKKGYVDPDSLLEDQDFRSRAVEAWGLDPTKTSQQFQQQLEKTKKELDEREIKPRQAAVEKLLDEVDKYRYRDLQGQIVQAAAALKVDEKFLKPTVKGGKPLIVAMLQEGFDFDEDNDGWFAKGSGGNPFAFSQGGDVPYMSVSEFMQQWVNAEGKDFVRNERQGGAEARPEGASNTGRSGGKLRITSEQARDIAQFRQLQARAEKEHLEIEVVG
jgi:hypothetical protein